MDSLLAGTLILPWRVHCAGYDVQRRCACQNIPGNAKAIPGSGENRSPSRRNRCSPSARNPVRLHPGIVFAFTPESRSPCPGIRKQSEAWLVETEDWSCGSRPVSVSIDLAENRSLGEDEGECLR